MKKRPRERKPSHPSLESAAGPALIKYLASCNPRVRSQSLQLIQSWLAAQPQILAESDIRRLWKGLFYCLWHSDKTPNQVALINRLTSLFLSLRPPLSLEFFRGFLVTLRREWPGIDRLRLDKFYLLIRRFLRVLFEFLRSRDWDLEVVRGYINVLDENGFFADDKHRGNGVNYHVASVFLEEFKGIDFPVKKEVVDAILKPFFAVTSKSEDKILLGKVKSCLFDELVKLGKELLAQKSSGVSCEGNNNGGFLLGIVALKMGLSKNFYEIGSSVECIQGNRKLALGLYQDFQKLEKEFESSGIEIVIPEYASAADEVPQLIPLETHDSKSDLQDQKESEKSETNPRKDMNGGDVKKRKKKKRKTPSNAVESDEGATIALNSNVVISNLQKQFERVAEKETDSTMMIIDDDSYSSDTPLASMKQCKRKRRRTTEGTGRSDQGKDVDPHTAVDESDASEKQRTSGKKVRFSMKNNLVWKPQNPLPPENLRLPPSVAPRGSALKKGVPPGPIIEMVPLEKKFKQN
ncbi:hypothetical protein M569_11388 [Genlisea aurea]|uniref:Uncharacterized protein n=1 Tax=Genlisea aurea TaxID=192259 RepID=S8DU66_9LAMI|nr:hypothetical protein M569_11388 [Genlisea aurea]